MLILNTLPNHRQPLAAVDAAAFGAQAADDVAGFLRLRDGHAPTPLLSLPGLARELGIGAIHIKDEDKRLGLGSFKALGGAYAVVRVVLEAASARLGRKVDIAEWRSPEVADVAAGMTFACATDGNHGRSVAQGARLVGAQSVVFVHAGVSDERVAAIASYGARMVRVDGGYDASVREAARQAEANGWTVVSDTSWPGYETIPRLVMQGYTALVAEALAAMPAPPTHVFVQAGVGGIAAAVAAHMALIFGEARPFMGVVEPSLAACVFASAGAGRPVKVAHAGATVMAMLECHEPSLVAFDILSRAADAFMTVEDDDAVMVMRRLARPAAGDPAVVAGESGGVGLAGLIKAAGDPALRAATGLGPQSRVFLINTEGATDPALYRQLVGAPPEAAEMSMA